MLATTKQVRKLVRSFCTVYTHSYTDKSASKIKSGTNLRNITFLAQYSTTQEDAERLRVVMFLCGYTNTVSGRYASVGGGRSNTSSAIFSTIR
jgi:hypothetical protein